MSKKKIKEDEPIEEETLSIEGEDAEEDDAIIDDPIVDDYDDDEIIDDEDVIDSSLEIGGQIHTQSEVVKKFKQLPKDVKYSKFNLMDVKNFTMKSNAYQLWNYIKKIKALSAAEIVIMKENKKQIYEIGNAEDLKQHLDNIGKSHLWFSLQQLSDEEFKKYFELMLKQLKLVKETGIIETIYKDKTTFKDSYLEYLNNIHTDNNYIDDFGIMNHMMTLTEANKASKGWAMNSMNTTINVTKNEDLTPQTEEQPEDSESRTKSFFKR